MAAFCNSCAIVSLASAKYLGSNFANAVLVPLASAGLLLSSNGAKSFSILIFKLSFANLPLLGFNLLSIAEYGFFIVTYSASIVFLFIASLALLAALIASSTS
ncbi:MAG: hypothetical protein IRF12RH_06320 [Rickettsia helvetica]|uniref:Uncharacterized protein n=1 Tax=Rickettsia helvetica TaxID=35789 RepID=A0ABP0T5L9_RICHE